MKRSFVADASVAIAWVHPAQATRETDAMLDHIAAGDSLIVPALWSLEVANALTVLRRRRKLTPDEARMAIEVIRELPISIDHEAAAIAFTRLADLASEHDLTIYDATLYRTRHAQTVAARVERRPAETRSGASGRKPVAK